MGFQYVFQRYELKYLLTDEQKETVLRQISDYTVPDKYGKSTVRNLYFDTDNYRLIRRSLDKPEYKEKLRIRSYSTVKEDGEVFVEVKKKYKGVVYKRRMTMPQNRAIAWLRGGAGPEPPTQISRELEYFRDFYGELSPKVFLSYNRQAYYSENDSGFRITLDDNVTCRFDGLSLSEEPGGIALLPAGITLMEVKCLGGFPLWMTSILTENKLYKASFSKYGTAYSSYIFPKTVNKEIIYV